MDSASEKKSEQKMAKYGPLRFKLKKQYPTFNNEQRNIIVDILRGWPKMRKLFGSEGYDILRRRTLDCLLGLDHTGNLISFNLTGFSLTVPSECIGYATHPMLLYFSIHTFINKLLIVMMIIMMITGKLQSFAFPRKECSLVTCHFIYRYG